MPQRTVDLNSALVPINYSSHSDGAKDPNLSLTGSRHLSGMALSTTLVQAKKATDAVTAEAARPMNIIPATE